MTEIWDLVQQNRLSSPNYSRDDLDSMLSVCAPHLRGQRAFEAAHAIERIRDEIARREAQRADEIRRAEAAAAEQREASRQKALTELKLKREAEHTLWSYWKLADWRERLGTVSFLLGVFLFGYLCSKMNVASRIVDLIRDVTP